MIQIEKSQVLPRIIKMKTLNQNNEQYVSADCVQCKYRDACPIANTFKEFYKRQILDFTGNSITLVHELISPEKCSMFQVAKADLMDKKVKKQKVKTPLFAEAMEVYCTWHYDKFGIKSRVMISDASALKSILKHMETMASELYSSCALFKIMLDNWDKLDPFLQKGTDLRIINSNLNSILKNLKNGKQSTQPKYISAADKNKSELRDMAEESKRNLSGA